MFETYAGKEKRGWPRPAVLIALAVSLIVHGALVCGLYHARITVKILPLGEKDLRNVTIVPPLPGPKIVGPAPGAGAANPGPAEEGMSGARPAEVSPPEPGPGPAAKPGAAGAPETSAGEPSPAVRALSSKFSESVASRFKTGTGSGPTIRLGPPGTNPPAPEGKGAAEGRGRPNFFQYIGGSGTGRGGRGGGPAGRGRGGSGGFGQRAAMTIHLKGYNLEPWARLVVDALQRNWDLPAVGKPGAEVRVRLSALIRKDGSADSLEILETTGVEILDQAALKAVRTSLPFPALPGDFPGDMLAVDFEFIYE